MCLSGIIEGSFTKGLSTPVWAVGREPPNRRLCKAWRRNHYQHREIRGCLVRSVAFSRGIKPTCSKCSRGLQSWLTCLPSPSMLLMPTASYRLTPHRGRKARMRQCLLCASLLGTQSKIYRDAAGQTCD